MPLYFEDLSKVLGGQKIFKIIYRYKIFPEVPMYKIYSNDPLCIGDSLKVVYREGLINVFILKSFE